MGRMNDTQTETLRELMRRVDDVRGLSESAEDASAADALRPETLIQTLNELVMELERSHRRLIETNVQLVSLREVASSTVNALDTGETTRLVTRYLCRAFGLEDGFLLLINRETGRLEGTWTHVEEGREQGFAVELALTGDSGALSRCLWLDRTVVHHAPRGQMTASLPDGHPLHDVLDRLGSTACVPLRRGHTGSPGGAPNRRCASHCVLGDATLLAPPPGPEAQTWAVRREERQRECLACEFMPLLGVIGMARNAATPSIGPADVRLLESIALSIGPVVENARLYQELRRSEHFREHVLDSMASALAAVNMKGEILTFNRAAEELLGAHEAEVLGQPFGALFGTDGDMLVRETLERGRELLRVEALLRTRDGAAVPVSFTTSLLRDDRRCVYGAIATFMDLTPLKRAEEHVRRMDRLAALGRFTSSVAHEIRNPLTGIGAGIQYLSRSLDPEGPQRENLNFILNEIRRLDRIIQDLFEITHPRGLSPRAAPIEETVRRALQCLEALMKERRVDVRLVVGPRTPTVSHDADQMEQVFINLIKNATEASPPGTSLAISIGIAPNGSRPAAERLSGRDAPGVVVRVQDRGPGIGADDLKTIFEPFFTTKPGGTGLGLYISHDIVKRHGGSLTVTSEPGRGATFTVELPLEHHGGIS
jgi:PAS domain S-box-containing protein